MDEFIEIATKLALFLGGNYLIYRAFKWCVKYDDYKNDSEVFFFLKWEPEKLIEFRNSCLEEYKKSRKGRYLIKLKNIDSALSIKQKIQEKG